MSKKPAESFKDWLAFPIFDSKINLIDEKTHLS